MKLECLQIVYAALATVSIGFFIFYSLFHKKRTPLFVALFGCITAVNCGYFLLSISSSLTVAKLANGISYFGAAYSMLVMLFIICDVCQIKTKIWVKAIFAFVTTAAFLLASSGERFGLYYRGLSIENVNGVTHLVKEYGPLHFLYAIYLLSYMIIMVITIAYAIYRKKLPSVKYALFLIVSVFLNMGVWAIEQMIDEEFEFLAISYIITEIILLLIYDLFCEYGIIRPDVGIVSVQMLTQIHNRVGELPAEMKELFDSFSEKVTTLSVTERKILGYYIDGHEISEIPQLAFISIYTVKKHNHSIYQKLNIASRDELMLYIELFRCCGRLDELR